LNKHEFEVVTVVKVKVVWDVKPCGVVDRYHCFGGICALHLYTAQEVEAADSYETFMPTYQTTRNHIPDDHDLKHSTF
jgi:hypothetical protein